MDKFDRIERTCRVFKSRKLAVSALDIVRELECYLETVRRSMEPLRNYPNVPIDYDRNRHDYCCRGGLVDVFALSCMRVTAQALQSLAALLALLNRMSGHLLEEALSGVEKQINTWLIARDLSVDGLERRVRFLPAVKCILVSRIFTLVSEALLKRQQLVIHYYNYSPQKSRRTISLQTLVCYR